MTPGLLVLLVPLGGCATRGDLEDLRGEVLALSARQDSAFAALQRSVDERYRAVMDSVRALSEQVFRVRGDASGGLRDIRSDLDGVQELAGMNQRTLSQLAEKMDRDMRQLEDQMARLAAVEDSTIADGETRDPDPAESTGIAADEQALFDVAANSAERGLYTTAFRGFTQFLDQYPRSELAPAALLHRGEVLTHQGRLEDAIGDYLEIPTMFPTSDRIPAALYRAGVLCIELEDYDRAREYLERLVNTYPEDPFAEQAREKLDEIP